MTAITPIFSAVGGHALPPTEPGEHRCQSVADERAAHIRVHIAPGHPGNRLQVAEVFRHQNHRHGSDQHHCLAVKGRGSHLRQTEPRRLLKQAKIQRLAQPEAVGQQRVQRAGDNQPDEDQQPLQHPAG